MPDVVTKVSDRNIYFSSYVETYIKQDVFSVINPSYEVPFRNMLSLLALRTGQELHYDTISTMLGIDVRTLKKWISILESSGVIYLLHPFMSNMSSRIIKSPKLYFMDTVLCCYFAQIDNPFHLQNGPFARQFFETFIVSEIIKNLINHNIDPQTCLYFYRDIDQKEVDILFVKNDCIIPIEIKKGIKPTNPSKNFSMLKKYNMKIETGLVIDSCEKIHPINDDVYAFPYYFI